MKERNFNCMNFKFLKEIKEAKIANETNNIFFCFLNK